MRQVLVVAAGSALGGALRYLIGTRVTAWLGGWVPWGTFTVNVTGCFLISFIVGLVSAGAPISPQTRLFLTTGIMGGLTTYSAFNFETLLLAEQQGGMHAAGYVVLTMALCLVAGLGGASLAALLAR
jgi:fluoride exporter